MPGRAIPPKTPINDLQDHIVLRVRLQPWVVGTDEVVVQETLLCNSLMMHCDYEETAEKGSSFPSPKLEFVDNLFTTPWEWKILVTSYI